VGLPDEENGRPKAGNERQANEYRKWRSCTACTTSAEKHEQADRVEHTNRRITKIHRQTKVLTVDSRSKPFPNTPPSPPVARRQSSAVEAKDHSWVQCTTDYRLSDSQSGACGMKATLLLVRWTDLALAEPLLCTETKAEAIKEAGRVT
jgi:hypothetical protein